MQKCFYHAKSDAATTCMGCKMPICQTCQDEGTRGFCERCMKKVAQLSASVSDTKKTGIMSSHKATMLKTTGRPTGPKNVTYCFQHFDAVATGTCPTCSRPFCPACLDPSGMCTHCASQADEPAPRSFQPAERPAAEAPARRPAPAPKPRPLGPAPLIIGAIALVGVVVMLGWFTHKPATPRAAAPQAVEQPAD